MDSKGVEVVLNYKDDWNGLHWNLGTTFSYATNEIIEIDEPADVSDLMKKEGRAYGTRFGYLSNGLFQSQEEIDSWAIQDNNDNSSLQPGDIRYVDISGPEGVPDGKIDGDDRTVIGKVAQPEIIYGINFSLSYKGFGLTTNWQGAANYEKQHRLASFINNGNNIKELNDSWSPENRDAKYPRLGVGMPVNNDKNTDFWMVDASYLRLKNLTFEYNLNSSKLQNYLNISSVRFFFTGTNLLTFSAVDYLDPDGPANPTPFYPVMKSYSMGVNIIF